MSHDIAHILEELEHLLPAQRALEAFVHHNTLHSFEHLTFQEAVKQASDLYGAEPYMPEASFREAYRTGRIASVDIDIVLREALGDATAELGARRLPLVDIARAWMLAMPEPDDGATLHFRLNETDELLDYPEDLERFALERLVEQGPAHDVQPKLWTAISAIAPKASATRRPSHTFELFDARRQADALDTVNAFMIRWCAAFVDGGQCYWPMSDREGGFLRAMLRHLSQPGLRGSRWRHRLAARAQVLLGERSESLSVIEGVLRRMGVPPDLWTAYLRTSLLALPGWPGMFVQLAARPDLTPAPLPPTSLADYTAVRLLVEEAVVGDGDALQRSFQDPLPAPPRHSRWELFCAARALGVVPDEVGRPVLEQLTGLLERFSDVERRALWQEAFERRFRVRTLDAVLVHGRRAAARSLPPARVQVVTCIDDREESLRRHIEELRPDYETFGGAGYYGVAAYVERLNAPDARPLCPANLVPDHILREVPRDGQVKRTGLALAKEWAFAGGAGLVRGVALSLWGWAAVVPMAADLLFPGLFTRYLLPPTTQPTKLALEHEGEHVGRLKVGFEVPEMADIVENMLRTLGLPNRMAPLVIFLGHGSHSRNNPHEAGYNCGACAGGRGGVNARAFAQMANRPDVRELLAARGLSIPASTWIVGGYHDTCDDEIMLYDLDEVPAEHQEALEEVRAVFDQARRRDAHERCRRFGSAPLELSEAEALAHVQSRSEDLAQARPEYNHAGNALCLVGRRSWSRGLFLDRRAFLTSYDPRDDADGKLLEALLLSVGPVGAGINLEYYFSYVDKRKYGSDNKLPHNIVSLVGVMDGHQSDLRTGLYWQMVEIHEPMRLLNIVEARPERLEAILDAQPALKQLVDNRWILLAAYDPESHQCWFYGRKGFEEHIPESTKLPAKPVSRDWYEQRRDNLLPATIGLEGAA